MRRIPWINKVVVVVVVVVVCKGPVYMEEGRAPSRYSRGHGFESRSSLNFSGFPFVTAIHKCDDLKLT